MKKIFYSALCVAALATTSCSDFLEVSSPSVVDTDFVFSNSTTARAAMHGAYESWRSVCNDGVFGAGLFYAVDIAGSDIERHPEYFAKQYPRHWPESLYQNGNFTGQYDIDSYDRTEKTYNKLFEVIGKANVVITNMEAASNFEELMSSTEPSNLTQIYGEAIAMRASAYRELIKYYGDVPYQSTYGVPASGLAPRDSIYDVCIADLRRVEPLMYKLGAAPEFPAGNKNYFSRTYVQGLIGRMCLDAAGYQTRRTDLGADFYKDGEGNVVTFEKKGTDHHGATYGRRTDWKDYYVIAKGYLKACIEDSGTAQFVTSDSRTNGNPYQFYFQEMHDSDVAYATESIYEYPQQFGGSTERPYSSGRPSNGGGSKAFPCKAYGQARIHPVFYYGMSDPNDMRRDVSVAVTGSSGAGVEVLIPWTPASVAKGGGLALNKFDENRQANPSVIKQRQSGINGPWMRLPEIYLAYAECCALTGEEGVAKTYLTKIRERAFPAGKANVDAFITKCGGLFEAILEERAFEFAGEGDRRWTLIRTGLLGEKIKALKEETARMYAALESEGYYEFANGNVLPSHVYTKLVDAKKEYGYRLTMECPDKNDPVLYPGWRGQNNDWTSLALANAIADPYGGKTDVATNLAIKGLFEQISEAEGEALVAEGWTKVDWGAELIVPEVKDEYLDKVFYQYDYVSAPIYLFPFTPNIVATGGFTNGYGFSNE